MEAARTTPAFVLDERPMLDGWLEYHRETLARKCEGLNAEQLAARSVPPSSMSLLGLVRHMAEVERFWFRRCFAGESDVRSIYCSKDDRDGDFDNASAENVDEGFATWRAECDVARAIGANAALEALSAKLHDDANVPMRWLLTHMIEEYARHNGHADLLRECIDGTTGD